MSSAAKDFYVKPSTSSLWKLMRCLKPYWVTVTLAVILMVSSNLCSLAMTLLARDAFNVIAPQVRQEELANPLTLTRERPRQSSLHNAKPLSREGREKMRKLGIAALKLLGLALATGLFGFLGVLLSSSVALKVMQSLRDRLYAKLHHLSISFFDQERTGHLMSRIILDTSVLQNLLSEEVLTVVASPFTIIAGLILMFHLDWQLTLVFIVLFPLTMLAIARAGRRVRSLAGQVQAKIAQLSALLQETISGIRLIRAFGTADYETKRFAERNLDVRRTAVRTIRISALLKPVISILAGVGMVSALLLGGYQLVAGLVDAGSLIVFVFVVPRIGSEANKMGRVNLILQQIGASADRIFSLLELPSEEKEEGKISPPHLEGRLRFDAVSFSYDHNELALRDVSLEINSGEKVAIVGPSGAGKSTIINLILKLYKPTSGSILLDDYDIRDLTMGCLTKNIALVPQDPILFSATISENIAYGMQGVEQERIIRAAIAANAHDFIMSFSGGYDSLVGERGVTLSGGQRQRIAIARAILRNPRILLLDEATSSLDAESEAAVHEALKNLMEGRTTLIIAHRLSSIREADRIFVLGKGTIVESGTHESLLMDGGLYRRMYLSQEGLADATTSQ